MCLQDGAFVNYLPAAAIRFLAYRFDNKGVLPPRTGRTLSRAVQWMSVWSQFYRSWQALRHARSAAEALRRLPNLE